MRADLLVCEGGIHDLVIELSDQPSCDPIADPDTLWASTENRWRQTIPALNSSVAPRDARHSYAALQET